MSGDIRIDPILTDYTEGVFTFDIVASQQRATKESIQIAHIYKQVSLFEFIKSATLFRSRELSVKLLNIFVECVSLTIV